MLGCSKVPHLSRAQVHTLSVRTDRCYARALNKLPPKYVRHEVDLVFYRTDAENDMMHANLDLVIKLAYETVALCERSIGSGL